MVVAMASGSSMLSGRSLGSVRPGLRIAPSMTRWTTRMPCGCSSRALGEAAKRELAHGEGGRARIALHAGRGAGEDDGTLAVGQHPPHGLLGHQEGAEGGDHERAADLLGVDSTRGPRAQARVVDHGVRGAVLIQGREQGGYLGGIGRVAAVGRGPVSRQGPAAPAGGRPASPGHPRGRRRGQARR